MGFLRAIGLGLVLLISSCTKSRHNPVTVMLHNSRISKIITTANDTVNTMRLVYNASGKLLQIIDSNHKNSRKEIKTIIYTNDGNLSKIIHNKNSSPPDLVDSFSLNLNGQVIISSSSSIYLSYPVTRLYTYDGAGRLLTDSSYTYSLSYATYHYNAGGDLAEWKAYGPSPFTGETSLIGTIKCTFNTLANPYKPLGLVYFFAKKDRTILSEHQLISEHISGTAPSSFSYEYLPSGLVKKITMMRGSYGVGKFIEFVYE